MKRPITLKLYFSRYVLRQYIIKEDYRQKLYRWRYIITNYDEFIYFEPADTTRYHDFKIELIYMREVFKQRKIFKEMYGEYAKKIQRQFRKSANNPEYKLCRDIMRRKFAE